MVPAPIIPAQAGIHEALIWIPACAGMIGLLSLGDNRKRNMFFNRP